MATIMLPHAKVEVEAFGFDVDGVLRDTGYLAFQNCRLAIAELGGKPPEFEDFVHDWSGILVDYYRSQGVVASDEEIERVNQSYIAAHDFVLPFDDVMPMLTHLEAAGVRVFALSGHHTDQLREWFAEHGLHPKFAHIRGNGREKVAHLRELCVEMSVAPNTACYVGDWAQDVRAAKQVGMIPIGLTRLRNTRHVLMKNGASLVLDHLAELAPLIS